MFESIQVGEMIDMDLMQVLPKNLTDKGLSTSK